MMNYDRDLKLMLRVTWVLLALNAAGAILAGFRRDWFGAGAYVIWIVNICFWREMMKSSQRTRDVARVTDAAVLKVLEEANRED